MRRPIQIQLLLPTLSVVVLAIALASGASGYFGAMRQRQSQEESLRRVVATLTQGPFPLNNTLLRQVSDLSGAEFAFLDTNQKVLVHTLPLTPEDERRLASLPGGKSAGESETAKIGAAEPGTGRAHLLEPADGDDRGARAGRGIRFAGGALLARTLVGGHVAGRLSGFGGRRGRRAGRGSGHHAPGPALRAAHPPPRRSNGPHR